MDRDLYLQWKEAAAHFDKGEILVAFSLFMQISATAKLHFNVAACALRLGDIGTAILALQAALKLDDYLGVAYLQLGYCYYLQGKFQDSLAQFLSAYKCIRGNIYVDYSQLGLPYELTAAHVWFNIGICQSKLNMQEAKHFYEKSCHILSHFKLSPLHRADLQIISQTVKATKLSAKAEINASPFCVPTCMIFKMSANLENHMEKVDYLGKANVLYDSLANLHRSAILKVPPRTSSFEIDAISA